jgi:hypothetical protein
MVPSAGTDRPTVVFIIESCPDFEEKSYSSAYFKRQFESDGELDTHKRSVIDHKRLLGS